jgi:V8-like Glu-specific endopeptidase
MKNAIATLVLALFGGVLATAAIAQVTVNGRIATYVVPPARAGAGIDYANAKPLPMPLAIIPPISQSEAIRRAPDPLMLFGSPKVLPGSVGSGKEDPIRLAPPKQLPQQDRVIPPEFVTADLPYTTSRVNAEGDYTARYFPFRAAGKLFITKGGDSVCSASLINRGLAVTAAHCVVTYGTRKFFTFALYVPAYWDGFGPYNQATVASARVVNAYIDGTDHCVGIPDGVICPDDIAVLTLTPPVLDHPWIGDSTGWFGVGYDGYGFTASGQALIDQLGYPDALDLGEVMERNDAQGFISAENANNTIIGSLMTGGSSGGPYLVNLGVTPTLSPFLRFGRDAAPNVVGVASFVTPNKMGQVTRAGASPFRVTNIQALIIEACHATPAACK